MKSCGHACNGLARVGMLAVCRQQARLASAMVESQGLSKHVADDQRWVTALSEPEVLAAWASVGDAPSPENQKPTFPLEGRRLAQACLNSKERWSPKPPTAGWLCSRRWGGLTWIEGFARARPSIGRRSHRGGADLPSGR